MQIKTRQWCALGAMFLGLAGCVGRTPEVEQPPRDKLLENTKSIGPDVQAQRDQPAPESAGLMARMGIVGELDEHASFDSPPAPSADKQGGKGKRHHARAARAPRPNEQAITLGAPTPTPTAESSALGALGLGTVGTGGGGGGGGVGSGYGRGAGGALAGGPERKVRGKLRSHGYSVSGGALALRGRSPSTNFNREAYKHTQESDFFNVGDQALSTFSVDVDTASYANVRRFLLDGQLPPTGAVRVEEMLNYFDYSYGGPAKDEPFALHTEVSDCPWNPDHRLVHLGLKTRAFSQAHTPRRNLVFLVDVSGSMRSPDKLPLLKRGMVMLAKNLRKQDRVSIVVYAGASGVALPPTAGNDTARIVNALEALQAGGSTHGSAGIQLAYDTAQKHFVKGAINRVILATDGDFNVGVSSESELVRLIEKKRKTGIFLTVLGFGRGNLQDSRMESLADKGNGNYAYIDSFAEARKVLVREAGSTLITVAKDVKLQVEFNPALVSRYRLIGYENRTLAARDFNDDKKDAGEVGAGHTVTALYEIVPTGSQADASEVDPLRYQKTPVLSGEARSSGELLTLKVRYKSPQGSKSRLLQRRVLDQHRALSSSSPAFRFSAAVAGFGMLLRKSEHADAVDLRALRERAAGAVGQDEHGDRAGLVALMREADRLGLGG